MSDATALLTAIRESPADDAPRLVYADWLDEHGRPERAEFIRVQCLRARAELWSDEWYDSGARARALLDVHGEVWKAPLKPFQIAGDFERGFLERAWVAITTFQDKFAAIAAVEPITDVWFRITPSVSLAKRKDHPSMAWVRRITIAMHDKPLGPNRAADLLGSRQLGRLERLVLDYNRLGSSGLDTILSANLPALRRLSVRENDLRDGVRALSLDRCAETVGRLERLNLCDNNIPRAGCEMIAGAPFRCLRSLDFGRDALGQNLSAAFGPWAATLAHLSPPETVPDSAFAETFTPGRFPALKSLNLRERGPITPARLSLLSDPARFPRLEHLDLFGARTGRDDPAAIRAFLASPVAKALTALDLPESPVWTAELGAIAAPMNLRSLSVQCTRTTPGGTLAEIATNPNLGRVREWRIQGIRDELDEVLRPLARTAEFTKLRCMAVGWRELSPETRAAWEGRYGPGLFH